MAELRSQLESMGADLVLTEEEMRATKVTDPSFECFTRFDNVFREYAQVTYIRFQVWKSGELPKPKLGLNCVGGASGLELCKVDLALCPFHIHVLFRYWQTGVSMSPMGV